MAETLAGVGYWRMETATTRIRWSQNMYRIFGFEPGDAPSLTEAMARVHPDDREAADGSLADDLAGGERAAASAVRVVWPSGEIRYIEGRSTSLKGEDGSVIAVVGAVLDVTERKRAELELVGAKEEAERAVAEKSTFVANVTHELRTPLTAIIGYANLLEENGQPNPRRLALLQGAGRTLLSIVNNILDYSRIEEGRAEIVPVATSPLEIGQECLDLFTAAAEERRLELSLGTAGEVPASVMIDPDALRQILVNLIGNAVKFTERGWVRLSVGYEAGVLRLSIADSGAGMTSTELDRLFQRYTRIRTRQEGAAGAGLGLAICKGLVSAMGGTIRASAAEGAGACFVCEIPAAAASASHTPDASVGLAGVQVLVADDNPSVREISRCILEAAGARVVDANDGISAVALASGQRFDILFIDLNMPGISGKEVVKYLRSLGVNTRAPIYAFTANGAFTAAEARAEGFDGLFTKPIDPRKMVSLVHAAMVQRAA